MNDLTGKIAIVTGATRGIGRATTEMLAKLGCTVVAVYRSREDLAKKLKKVSQNIYPIQANIGDENDVLRVIKKPFNNSIRLIFL